MTHQYVKARKLISRVIENFEMARYVDLSPYWTEDKKLSIQSAKDKTGLDKRTLSAAKKGQLDRGHFETLYKLRDLASELAGRPLTIEEIFRND